MKNLVDLKLHETVELENNDLPCDVYVMRVVGGYIYIFDHKEGYAISTKFVEE